MGGQNGKYVLTEHDVQYLSKYTGMREQDIHLRFQQFLQQHPDGKIPKKAYMAVLQNCYSQTSVEKLEEVVFNVYDENGDGYVDFKEFLLVLHSLSAGTPKEKLEQIFRSFDITNSGVLTREEVNLLVTRIYHLLGKTNK